MSKFNDELSQYVCFGSSVMCSTVEAGVLRWRPYGGVMVLVSKKLQSHTELICAADRCAIFIIGDLLIVNVYLKCIGTTNRLLICEEIFADLSSHLCKFPNHKMIIGGDFNVDLDACNQLCDFKVFLQNNAFQPCDDCLTVMLSLLVSWVHILMTQLAVRVE